MQKDNTSTPLTPTGRVRHRRRSNEVSHIIKSGFGHCHSHLKLMMLYLLGFGFVIRDGMMGTIEI